MRRQPSQRAMGGRECIIVVKVEGKLCVSDEEMRFISRLSPEGVWNMVNISAMLLRWGGKR